MKIQRIQVSGLYSATDGTSPPAKAENTIEEEAERL